MLLSIFVSEMNKKERRERKREKAPQHYSGRSVFLLDYLQVNMQTKPALCFKKL